MRVKMQNGETIDVKFFSTKVTQELLRKDKNGSRIVKIPVRETFCRISSVTEQDGKASYSVIAEGNAKQNSNDQDNRKIGQKIAFLNTIEGSDFNRSQRQEICGGVVPKLISKK